MVNVIDILINFAGDVFLAEAVKDYLSSKGFVLNVHMTPDRDEISISIQENNMRKGNILIKEILRNYLDEHNLTKYNVTEFENILTVGIPKKIEDISNLVMCEICGWRLNTEEELLIHRRTHWI
ncbi:MAG: C2H2-type zinc finger protein [Nitrososphaeraceae archaeon]